MIQQREFRLPFILPSKENIIKRLNYNPKKTILDRNVIDLIQNVLDNSKNFIHPIALVKEVKIDCIDEKNIILEDGEKMISTKLSAVLKRSRFITLIAATIGEDIKKEIENQMNNENFTEAVILDAIASEAVEAFVDHIENILIVEKRLSGFMATMRYSPGYGDLPLSINPYILEKVDAKKIGVSYHPVSYMLIPEKSITAIIGWER